MGDNKFYYELDFKTRILLFLRNDHWISINRYLRFLRKEELYQKKKGIQNKLLSVFWSQKKNRLGNKLGFFIPPFTLGKNVTIYHHGSIVINGDARIGENCVFHGMNCVGNDGASPGAPIIGNNVDIGVGAKIIGPVKIADNVKIGANAVVVHDCNMPGVTLVGIPAKEIIK